MTFYKGRLFWLGIIIKLVFLLAVYLVAISCLFTWLGCTGTRLYPECTGCYIVYIVYIVVYGVGRGGDTHTHVCVCPPYSSLSRLFLNFFSSVDLIGLMKGQKVE